MYHMSQPYLDILVDGVMQQRSAYFVWVEHDPERSIGWGHEELRPYLNEDEELKQTINGDMFIVTIPENPT